MIDTQAIRNKVLDLAMQGQLTEQQTDDVNVEKLYEDIIKSKDQILQKRKGRKDNNIKEIGNDTPFDIPAHWKWIRFGDVGLFKKGPFGSALTKSMFVPKNDNAVKVYEQQHAIKKDANLGTYYITKEYFDEKMTGFEVQPGDIIVSCAGTIGETYILPENIEQGIINQALMRITLVEEINKRFFLYYFDSNLKKNAQEESNGSAIKNIPPFDVMKNWYFPLMSIEEQERIVERIESIFKQLDVIDELQNQYASNQEDLKSKLIEAAIQGKLTEQLPEDGTADVLYHSILEEKQLLIKAGKLKKEKSLSEIVEDEIPFEIPENWRWVRISDVIDVRDGTHDSPKYHDEGIPLVTSKNISSGKLIFDDVKLISMDDAQKINERSYVDDGDILFAMIGSIGNPVIVHKDREFCIKNVALFKNFAPMHISMDYFYWFLMHEQFVLRKNAIGGLQPFVSLKVFRSHLMPLPPMSEQIRIAERLYELEWKM